MTLTQWFLFFILIQVIHFLGTWKLYQKAGRQAWEAAIPVYNAVILMKIINRPWWWVVLLFIPIVNLIMIPVVWVETIRSFGRNSTTDTVLVILTLGLYIFYVNYALDVTYIDNRSLKPRTATGEWINSILFAVVAATIVHTYFIQPFTIPSSSMEKTLLVGDFLFVSKINYGPRVPMTTVAFPMVHDTIPVLGIKSYLNWPQLPYMRLPGFEEVERNDIVVFNWPADTVPYFFYKGPKHFYKPIDKKSNYVKRAVGVAGDSLKIVNGQVYVNGQQSVLPERARPATSYLVQGKGHGFALEQLYKRYEITDPVYMIDREKNQFGFAAIATDRIEQFKNHQNVASAIPMVDSVGHSESGMFPVYKPQGWNRDNFGPVYIPEEDATVEINPTSIPFYRRIIETYEGSDMGINNEISIRGKQVLLNGKPLTSYTFKQDYYWMMGDNRHNSEDSRYWGFVPENHIVGKPVFIWMSWDGNANGFFDSIRWERLFTTVHGEGKPVS
ncbi:MAG TPA: signal peptidase I, partial [Flavobacteriaceae bacterium]|nr:signal peptidase I [Flavobacteriaceae bacterium]